MVVSEFELERFERKVDSFFLSFKEDRYFDECRFDYKFDELGVIFYESMPSTYALRKEIIRADYNSLDRKWYLKGKKANGDWFEYDPLPKVSKVEELLEEIALFISNRVIIKMYC